jgi:uncharacterized protein (DUF2267 family)
MDRRAHLLLALLALPACSTAKEAEKTPASVQEAIVASSPAAKSEQVAAEYPTVLRDVWDLAPYGCSAKNSGDSDSKFEISVRVLQGYENTDELKSIRQISDTPKAWLVFAVSNIAPREIQEPEIYILGGEDRLTISDGTTARTYIRCK